MLPGPTPTPVRTAGKEEALTKTTANPQWVGGGGGDALILTQSKTEGTQDLVLVPPPF